MRDNWICSWFLETTNVRVSALSNSRISKRPSKSKTALGSASSTNGNLDHAPKFKQARTAGTTFTFTELAWALPTVPLNAANSCRSSWRACWCCANIAPWESNARCMSAGSIWSDCSVSFRFKQDPVLHSRLKKQKTQNWEKSAQSKYKQKSIHAWDGTKTNPHKEQKNPWSKYKQKPIHTRNAKIQSTNKIIPQFSKMKTQTFHRLQAQVSNVSTHSAKEDPTLVDFYQCLSSLPDYEWAAAEPRQSSPGSCAL